MKKTGVFLIKALLFPWAVLPLKLHYFNAGFIAWLAGSVLRYRRDDVMINIARAFPEKDYSEIKEICRKFYRHFADLLVETVWFGGCRNPERLRKSGIVEVLNADELNALAARHDGMMILYTHCGNWELLGGIENYAPVLPFNEKNFCVVYRRMHSKVWDEVMHDNRLAPVKDRKCFPGYLESREVVRHVFTHRGQKIYYNFNTDQRPYEPGSGDVLVKFLGRECQTMSAAAALAHKFAMPVCYLKMPVLDRGHYGLEYITICEDASQMSVQQIMDRYYELLDEEIAAQPYNYLWSHRRWPGWRI